MHRREKSLIFLYNAWGDKIKDFIPMHPFYKKYQKLHKIFNKDK